jgi:hypothetical protein
LALGLAAPLRAAGTSGLTMSTGPFTSEQIETAVWRTTSDCTAAADVGPIDIALPLDLADALLDRPDLIAFLAGRRGLAPYTAEMLGPDRWSGDDGEGTNGIALLAESSSTLRVYYAEGVNRSLPFPPIRADVVAALDLVPRTDADGRSVVAASFRVCVRATNPFVSGIAKTLRPFVRRAIVRKFSKALRVADRLGRLMASDPDGVDADIAAYPPLSDAERADFRARIARLSAAVPAK